MSDIESVIISASASASASASTSIENEVSIQVGILDLKGQIYASNRGKYSYKFFPFNHEIEPLVVSTKINRVRAPANPVVTVKVTIRRDLDDNDKGHVKVKIEGQITGVIGYLNEYETLVTGYLNHYKLEKVLKSDQTPLLISRMIPEDKFVTFDRQAAVCSIDPYGCRDIDDALHLVCHPDGSSSLYVHITALLLKDDWQPSVTSTAYLSPSVYHMLGSENTEQFSLLPGRERKTISLKLDFDLNEQLEKYQFLLSKVTNTRAFSYEEIDRLLVYDTHWQLISRLTTTLQQTIWPETKATSTATATSHQIIEILMITYNLLGSRTIIEKDMQPILREHYGSNLRQVNFTNRLEEYLAIIESSAAHSTHYNGTPIVHGGLGLTNYGHLTSPIRRYVDLFNQELLFQSIFNQDDTTSVQIDQSRVVEIIKLVNSQEQQFRRLYRKLAILSLSRKFASHSSIEAEVTCIAIEVGQRQVRAYWDKERLTVKITVPPEFKLDELQVGKTLAVRLTFLKSNLRLPKIRGCATPF